MPWDFVAFGSSAARSGLQAVVPLEGASLSGYQVINTNFIRTKGPGAIASAGCISAAIANLLQWRVGVNSRDYSHMRCCARDQTSVPHEGTVAGLNMPLKAGDLVHVDVDNTNTAQVEVVWMSLCPGDMGLRWGGPCPAANARPIAGTGGTAAVALTWTRSTVTWGETFEQDVEYHIVGMSAHSVTMYGCRLAFTSGPMMAYHPGVPGGDTIVLQNPVWGNFGTFKGATPPNVEVLCSGTDASQNITLWIVPARRG